MDATMDAKAEARDFLVTRRARLRPADVGLTSYGPRHVPGLRREEVATLAGVSVEYYNRMERGNLAGVSAGVLDAIAAALHLDEAEHAHLHDLATAAGPRRPGRRRVPVRAVRPVVGWMIDAMTGAAAFVVNSRQDILVANRLGRAFLAPLFESAGPPNVARFTYLDPRAREFFADWDRAARECVAALRTQAGREPFDRGLSELVGELTTASDDFARAWATHDVRLHHRLQKEFRHPLVGPLTLQYDRLAVAGDPGPEIVVHVAEPGSRSAEGLALLADWSADSAPVHRPAPVERSV